MGGAYAFGELTLLAGIAQPQVGVVTNVYPVHLERMGTIEAIARNQDGAGPGPAGGRHRGAQRR